MRIFIFSALAVFIIGCSPTEEVEWSTETLSITATGPLFEGSNTGTHGWKTDLTKAIDGLDDLKNLVEARLISIEIKPEDVDVLEDVTIQLAGEKTGMQKIAFMSAGGVVQVANQQENLASFFLDNHPTLVADFNMLDDWFDDYIIEAKLTFLFKINTN